MWPERFSTDKDAFTAYKASSKRYYEYKREVNRLRSMEQSINASSAGSSSSSIRDVKRTAVGGGSADSAASDRGAAEGHAPPAGGPHNSPPDVLQNDAHGSDLAHDLSWFRQLGWSPDDDELGMSDLECAEFCDSTPSVIQHCFEHELLAPGDSWNF